jgi:signal transduction histidine kinase
MDVEEARLRRQAARMASLAELARPVQHEINNLLTVIFANLEMLKRSAGEGAPQRQLDRIQEAARRFEASTRSILSLIRRPVPEEGVQPLSDAVAALHPLLLVLLSNPGALSVEAEAGGWPVRIDRTALDDSLLALAREAAEALPRGGCLGIRVANHPGPPEMVELSVSRPEGVALPALASLRRLAETCGGEAAETAAEGMEVLRLLLPRRAAPA